MDATLLFIFNFSIFIIVTLITILYIYVKCKQSYWSRRGIYSPPCNWIFGHFKDAFLLNSSFSEVFANLHNATDPNEPVVGIYIMQKPFLLIRDPEIIKQILVKDFHIFSNRFFASRRKKDVIGSQNLFSIHNPKWKYIRAKLSPAFTSGKLKKLFELNILESTKNLENYLKQQISESAKMTIECRQLSTKYTTDIISSFSFGIQTNSFDVPESEFYLRSRSIFDLTLKRTAQYVTTFFFPKLADILNGSMLAESSEYFRKVFWESMDARELSGTTRGDIIDLLLNLKQEKQNPEFKFEGDYMVAQAAILLLAGLETSAVTMAFTLLELAKNPDIQNKVYNEIQAKLNKDQLTYEKALELTYLNQVISETLRLYPPAPILDRIASEDYTISGTNIKIEKGTAVYVSLKGIHEDPSYHPNPLKFDPDRFSESKKHDIQPCTYLPFGEGPRICIGMRIGQLQTVAGLVTILQDYRVTLNPKFKNEISKRAMILAPTDGVRLYFEKIKGI